MPFNSDFDAIRREADQLQAQQRAPRIDPRATDDDPLAAPSGGIFSFGDLALAPLRGLEGFGKSIYDLADVIAVDALPDWENRFLGQSRTAVGGFVEGTTQFLAGFIPVAGWVGKGAQIGRTFKLAGGLSKAAQAGRTGAAATATGLARGAAAGAIADFAAFDGQEERLSNWLEQFPVMSNPITGFLAAEEDDNEIVGRLKNTLEGLGLGALTDGVIQGVRAIKIARKGRRAGKAAETIQAEIDEAVPPEQFREALARGRDGEALDSLGKSANDGQLTTAARDRKSLGDRARAEGRPAPDLQPNPKLAVDPDVVKPRSGTPAGSDALLKSLGLGDADVRKVKDSLDLRKASGVDPRVSPRKLSAAERLAQGLEETQLNLSRFEGPDGALHMIRVAEDLGKLAGDKDVARLRRTGELPESLGLRETRVMAELADMVGETNPQDLMAQMERGIPDNLEKAVQINARTHAYKTLYQSFAKQTEADIAAALSAGGDSSKSMLEAAVKLEQLARIGKGIRGLVAEQGRALGQNRLPVKMLDLDDAAEMLNERGGRKHLEKILKKAQAVLSDTDSPAARAAALRKFADGTVGSKAWGVLTEYWFNSMLSGPKTQVVNFMSNAVTSLYVPMRRMLGGALRMESDVIADAAREITGLFYAAPEAFRVAKKVARGADAQLDPRNRKVEQGQNRAIQASTFGLDKNSVVGRAVDWVGGFANLPTTLLGASDEFFKQMNYRALARSQLVRQAIKDGKGPGAIESFVADEMDKLVFQGQAFSNDQLFRRGLEDARLSGIEDPLRAEVHAQEFAAREAQKPEFERRSALGKLAIDRAQEVTHTRPLAPGSLSARAQAAVNAHPYLRFIAPFIRTPVNIATFAGQHFDVVGVGQVLAAQRFPSVAKRLKESQRRMVKDLMSGDPRLVADARGRMAVGVSVMTMGTALAMNGTITGRGPARASQRRELEQAGWQPYSIRVGDTFVSYARLDPFSMMIGTFADMVEYGRWADDDSQTDVEQLAYGALAALANNFTNKTYMQGVSEFVEVIQDPERNVETWLAKFAGSFVPAASAQALVGPQDDSLRDVQGIMDQLYSRTPGLSETLPPRRNLLGEPVERTRSLGSDALGNWVNGFLPIAAREVSDDVIFRELARLEQGFSLPRRNRNGLNLSTVVNETGQDAYDRWGQLHGEVRLRGQTMRQAMKRLFKSAVYQRADNVTSAEFENPRVTMVNALIRDYRRAAFNQVLREYPELNLRDRELSRRRKAAKIGQLGETTSDRPQLFGLSIENPLEQS